MDRYEKAIEPFTKGRGVDWEVQVEDCDVSLQLLIFWSICTTDRAPRAASFLERERYKSAVAKYKGGEGMEGAEQTCAVLLVGIAVRCMWTCTRRLLRFRIDPEFYSCITFLWRQ